MMTWSGLTNVKIIYSSKAVPKKGIKCIRALMHFFRIINHHDITYPWILQSKDNGKTNSYIQNY